MRACRMENFKTFNAWSDTYYNNIDTTKDDAHERPGPRHRRNQNRAMMMVTSVSATTALKNSSPEMLLSSRPKRSAKDLLFVRSAVTFLKVANSFLTGSECYITGVFLSLQV